MGKALVTGANGFIGAHLVKKLLEQEREVCCLVRKSSKLGEISKLPVKFAYGDVTDYDSLCAAMDSVSTVFHLAGACQVVKNEQFYNVNTKGTKNVAKACSQQKEVPRLIFVSSLAAVGPARNREMQDETVPAQPVSHYGRSKHQAEEALVAISDEVPCSIVRPPYVFGEGDHASAPLFKLIYRKKLHLVPSLFNPQYSFVHADDLTRLLLQVEESGEFLCKDSLPVPDKENTSQTGQGIYFAARSERPRFGDFGKMIAASFGLEKIRVFRTPPMWIVWTGLFSELYKKITQKTVALDWNKACEALRGPWTCSEQKATVKLGFRTGGSFEEQLEKTSRWYLENNHC